MPDFKPWCLTEDERQAEMHIRLSQWPLWMASFGDKNDGMVEMSGISVSVALLWHPDRQGAEVAGLLLAACADANARDKSGKTALTLAEKRGFTKIAKALKARGATE